MARYEGKRITVTDCEDPNFGSTGTVTTEMPMDWIIASMSDGTNRAFKTSKVKIIKEEGKVVAK